MWSHSRVLTDHLCPVQAAGLSSHWIPNNPVGRKLPPPCHRREPEYSSGKMKDLHEVTELVK